MTICQNLECSFLSSSYTNDKVNILDLGSEGVGKEVDNANFNF